MSKISQNCFREDIALGIKNHLRRKWTHWRFLVIGTYWVGDVEFHISLLFRIKVCFFILLIITTSIFTTILPTRVFLVLLKSSQGRDVYIDGFTIFGFQEFKLILLKIFIFIFKPKKDLKTSWVVVVVATTSTIIHSLHIRIVFLFWFVTTPCISTNVGSIVVFLVALGSFWRMRYLNQWF